MESAPCNESVLAVNACHLLPLGRLAEQAGLDFSALLKRHGVAPVALNPAVGQRIALTDYYRLLQVLSVQLQDETCHLSSRPLIPGTSHFIWSHVIGAENLSQAMQRVASAYNLLHGGSYNHVEYDAGSLRYLIDDRCFPYAASNDQENIVFSLECVLIFLHCTLVMISSPALNDMLIRVYSRRSGTEDSHHLRFLGVPVTRNRRQYGLVYSAAATWLPVTAMPQSLPRPGAIYDRIIARIEQVQSAGDAATFGEQVRELLVGGLDSQHDVARELGMSKATLRRRLAAEGLSFREVRAHMLCRQAREMLAKGMRPAEVADQLGYSDTRSFNRAFANWRNITPAQFRRQMAGNTP